MQDLLAGVADCAARVVAHPRTACEQHVHEGAKAAAQRARGLVVAGIARESRVAHGLNGRVAREIARHDLCRVRDASPRLGVHARLHLEKIGQAGASPAARRERPLNDVLVGSHDARLAATLGDLCGDLGDELVEALLDGLVGAVADGDIAGLDLLLAQDEHVRHAVDGTGLADLVADLLVAVIAHGADAGGLELGGHLVGVGTALLGDGTLTWTGASHVGNLPA